ncbi:sensor histidine kinase [Mumia zhuanghuii]|uniref:Sensor histidine kinase n=2 Tax=Mumia TaxID=1546255 RepID=A0ABW1QGY1_9ACTN|nr:MULTISPECIES: histidine kinase [Mumia]KAA1422866.1 sensor histidine kinase [Mumia zhuanghuii]
MTPPPRPHGDPAPGPPWWRFLAAGVWLVYLWSPVVAISGAGGWERVLGLVAVAVFVATYLVLIGRNRRFVDFESRGPRWETWPWLITLLLCTVAMIPGAGDQALTALVFVAAAAMSTLSPRWAWGWVAVLLVVVEVSTRLVPGWSDGGNGFALILAAMAVFFLRAAIHRQRALVAAERELGDARLEEERSRIARDLHDILGHSLTVIAVKTELAERMLDVDPERTRSELADVRSLTRDALTDVRATVRDVRGVSLPGEIAAARSALRSAAIEADLPTVADDVPTRMRELFAWTVREGVTNVIRHSGATRCVVRLGAAGVSVADDGRGMIEGVSDGSGLLGLRQRAAQAGAALVLGPGLGGAGMSVAVVVPAAGQEEAGA